jgi:hypothetical protein
MLTKGPRGSPSALEDHQGPWRFTKSPGGSTGATGLPGLAVITWEIREAYPEAVELILQIWRPPPKVFGLTVEFNSCSLKDRPGNMRLRLETLGFTLEL